MKLRIAALIVFLLAACFLAVSWRSLGEYQVDTVTFKVAGVVPPAAGPTLNVHIDTHVKASGLFGGTVRSSKPYSIAIDYTDETFTIVAAEITKVTVTHTDGTGDSPVAALKGTVRFVARPYEVVNSGAGGQIVKTKVNVISGRLPGAITRDASFTLRMEGRLIKDDGSNVPFTFECKYDVVTDKSTKSWGSVMQDR